MTDREVIVETSSVCPQCLQRIPAERVAYGSEVYLEKTCPEHGFYKTILWRGSPDYRAWNRIKIPNPPRRPFTQPENGCPFDCGLCAGHRQEPCCVLLEVTQRCNLVCPVCFASAGETPRPDPDLDKIEAAYRRMLDAGGPFNIQLSGGEPSLRDDLAEIIALGRRLGFTYFQINTNGIRLAEDLLYLERLKTAGLNVVYLQFDGTDDAIYRSLRGRNLFDLKNQVIQNCRDLNIGVVLVPTVRPGLNAAHIGKIVRFALENYPVVRSIHFQPLSYFGRYPQPPSNETRITIPEILLAMQEQTGGLVHLEDFQPKGSENAYCSFHASYMIMPDGSLKPIKARKDDSCCEKPESASLGLKRSQAFVARNWTLPEPSVPAPASSGFPLDGLDFFLERARTHLFSISGMAFQDAWNLDLELLQDCCIEISGADGRLIPFCAYNLTDASGRAFYRPVNTRT